MKSVIAKKSHTVRKKTLVQLVLVLESKKVASKISKHHPTWDWLNIHHQMARNWLWLSTPATFHRVPSQSIKRGPHSRIFTTFGKQMAAAEGEMWKSSNRRLDSAGFFWCILTKSPSIKPVRDLIIEAKKQDLQQVIRVLEKTFATWNFGQWPWLFKGLHSWNFTNGDPTWP